MRHRVLLTASAGSFILATSTASATVTEIRARYVDPDDPVQAGGASGTWADNGYNAAALRTWRFYAVSNIADEILSVGDMFSGGSMVTISTSDGSSFVNGGLLNNGLQRPTDFTATPGLAGYQGQWDSFLAIDGLATVTFSPGLTTALGATTFGMGGLVGGSFSFDNMGWYTASTGSPNTTFNPASGFHEALFAQLTVPAGVSITIANVQLQSSTGFSPVLSVTTGSPPCPADIGRDQDVGFGDLTLVLLAWGPCPPMPALCPEDVDANGVVGFNDFVEVLLNWGACIPP